MIDFQNTEYFTHAVTVGGKILEVPLRKGKKDAAFIDALTFTVHKRTIENAKGLCFSDTEYVAAYSELLQEIFGFGVTTKLGKGSYFYQAYYKLGGDKADYGTLHIGGQRDTILVELTGTGCQAAKAGWEQRLYDFLKTASRPRITRVDLAHDFFNGEYSPEQAMCDHNNGLFNRHNKRPKSEMKGTAWREEDGTGKTFAVGTRGSSKYARIYEKGRQLGDKDSLWTRFEVEFRNKDCVIPMEILTNQGEFLTGAYPVGETLFNSPATSIAAATEKVNITFESRKTHAKNQVGRFVRFLKDIGWTPEQIVEALIADEGKYPKGLEPAEYDCQTDEAEYLNQDSLKVNGTTEPDELDQVIVLERKLRIFDETHTGKTEAEKQLLQDFPEDLKQWLDIWKRQQFYALSERDLSEYRRTEQQQKEFLDFLYSKYGSLFSLNDKYYTTF